MKKTGNKSGEKTLRFQAEKFLANKPLMPGQTLTESDIMKLNHELEVHQVELELQNQELVLAREQAESNADKYTRLYDFAPSGYFTLSRDGRILELNLHGAQMLGNVRTRLTNRFFGLYISATSRPDFNRFLEKIFTGDALESCELTLNLSGHSLIHVYLTGIADENSEHCFVTMFDITERKLMEADLKLAREKAEESDRLKSAFLANMSHEIRTPMNGILGFTDLLKEPMLTGEEKDKYIAVIQRSGLRLLNLINDIIDISKIEAGQMTTTISETSINEKIEFIFNFFKPQADQRGLGFTYNCPFSSATATIKTDGTKINAILTNLIHNAIKFTYKGSIDFGYEKKGEFLEFFVKDTGIGIHKNEQELIFDRFRQGEKKMPNNIAGTGLGLSISKAYIEMLNGRIWVESFTGKGSTFYFTIPYTPVKFGSNDTTVQ